MLVVVVTTLVGIFVFLKDISKGGTVVVSNIPPTSIPKVQVTEAPTPTPTEIPKDYSAWSFENLSQRQFSSGQIKIGKVLRKEDKYTSYAFTYQSGGKTTSGMLNKPNGGDKFPVIVLLHGWADKQYYHYGYGTEKSANYLAENGFLTLSPDFLGYGYSDWEDQDILVARFNKPVEVLDLLSSIDSLPSADANKVGIWAHSNGGQIALSVLEITGRSYPTTLWAPVSLDFPECVLTYLGTEEVGNIVKDKIDSFLILNDPKEFSIGPYLSKIISPFIVHQAITDEYIEKKWTDNLVNKLKNQGLKVDYYLYPKENHNFNRYKETGETLRERDLEFFRKQLDY